MINLMKILPRYGSLILFVLWTLFFHLLNIHVSVCFLVGASVVPLLTLNQAIGGVVEESNAALAKTRTRHSASVCA